MAIGTDRFDWALVRSFLAVLDAGSVTAAAKRLGAQQPTVSRHVAELEAQLGAPLFERTGRGVTPTAAALAIAAPARRMEDAALAVGRGLAGERSATRGVVRVTTSQVAASWLLPAVLARLQRAHPKIEVELVASNELTNLLRREADIAVRMVRPAQSSLVAKKLGEIEIVAAAHTAYLAKAPPLRSLADLGAHRLIGYDRDDTIVRGAARMGVALAPADFALRTDDQVAYGRLVAEGAGIGFVARYNLRHWPGVVAVLPGLITGTLPCWLAVHREIRSNPLVRTVYDFLGREIAPAIR
ncbi:MAG TPA: LysR family transcriptional regulator [Caldimonas sp.]|nr:LysR family transcriptional regulator [Caldimonas sp.]HEX4233046.1 LysR family transcriptional regulator [Caldimonas sp.]